ncbi:MAG: hypothetical protein ABJA78_10130 [Ferruginibacter sp.]
MQTTKGKLYPVVEQINNTTTSWIGRYPGEDNDIKSGQTFLSPSGGELDSIEIFSSLVVRSGEVLITFHEFDAVNKEWGIKIASASVMFNKSDSNKWISFPLQGIQLQQGKWYGFMLQSPSSLIGVGEAAGTHREPPNGEGQEWKFISGDNKGKAFTYFSLAFKVELRA